MMLMGNLILITTPDGSTRRFQYNGDHLLTGPGHGKVERQGFIYYDDLRRLTGSIFDDGTGTQVNPASVDTDQGSNGRQGYVASNPLTVS